MILTMEVCERFRHSRAETARAAAVVFLPANLEEGCEEIRSRQPVVKVRWVKDTEDGRRSLRMCWEPNPEATSGENAEAGQKAAVAGGPR